MAVAVKINKFAAPKEVVDVVDQPPLLARAGQVVIDLEYANINPSDCLTVRGMYGILPTTLPATLGNEGVGRVSAVGEGVSEKLLGKRVAMPIGGGIWASQVLGQADKIMPLPDQIDGQQLAMSLVNPPTAYLLLTSVKTLSAGDWVIQNAANSNVGQAVNVFAKDLGLNVINLVRSDAAAQTLGDHPHVLRSNAPDLGKQIRALVGEGSLSLALDAIGGDGTLQLADALSPGGTIVSYGALSGHACKLAPQHTIFKGLTLTGFWLVNWFGSASPAEMGAMSQRVGQKLMEGALNIPVEATYELADALKALEHAEQPGRSGKILFKGPAAA